MKRTEMFVDETKEEHNVGHGKAKVIVELGIVNERRGKGKKKREVG